MRLDLADYGLDEGCSRLCRASIAANATVAIPASSDTMEAEGRQMKQRFGCKKSRKVYK